MKIKQDYNLEDLVNEYGFQDNFGVYSYVLERKLYNKYDIEESSILVNAVNELDREIRFYYSNSNLEEIIKKDDIIDYAIKIPNVLLQMIKDGIVEE